MPLEQDRLRFFVASRIVRSQYASGLFWPFTKCAKQGQREPPQIITVPQLILYA